MREDIWTNSKTNTEFGITGPLGSPRGWLRRAFDIASLDVIAFSPGSLTPYEISVGAIWYRPKALMPGSKHRELYRFFDIALPDQLQKSAKNPKLHSAIGMAAAVPVTEILPWLAEAKANGAAYTWWKTPADKSVRAVVTKQRRRQLDHAKVYQMLDQGLKRSEIAKQLDYPVNNIDYVAKKWAQGLPLSERSPYFDHRDIEDDFRNGMSMDDLVARYQKSKSHIYSIVKETKSHVTNTTYDYS